MLIPGGLDHGEFKLVKAGLVAPLQRRQIEVDLFRRDNGGLVAHLTLETSGGQVTVDAMSDDTTPSRICEMSFVVDRRMMFEPQSSNDLPFHSAYAMRVHDCRWIVGVGKVEFPVFTGPLFDFDRTGREVQIVGHGWERQMFQTKWNQETFRKGTRKTSVIKALFREAGFTQLAGIPDLPARLPEKMTVGKRETLWAACQHLARSMDRHLFFDATGHPRLRREPDAPCIVLDDRHLMSEPVVDTDSSRTKNTFEVIGRKPKHHKRRVRDVRELGPAWGNSKENLKHNGKFYRDVLTEENDAIRTEAEAKARAIRLRSRAERGVTDTQVDVLPLPHLEELDLVAVKGESALGRVRVSRFTLPLGPEPAPLSINSLKHPRQVRGRGLSGRHLDRSWW